MDERLKEKISELGGIIDDFREKFLPVKKYSPPFLKINSPLLVGYFSLFWKFCRVFALIFSLFPT
jgi:hypothetical protein